MTTLPQDRASRHKLQGFCTTTVPTNILQWTSNLENPRKTGVYGRALTRDNGVNHASSLGSCDDQRKGSPEIHIA
jgi:hypothetical protein